jgi:dienelactone hydrolase
MKNQKKWITSVFTLLILSEASMAKLIEKNLEYQHEGQKYEAFVTWDDTLTAKAPAVLVVHDWMGIGDYSKRRARELAAMGYVAMAADVYGKGKLPKNRDEAAKMAGGLKKDRTKLRSVAKAAFEFLKTQEKVDVSSIGATGYCFGGTAVLEMARAGLPLKGVVSFHGGLAADAGTKNGTVTAKILVLHGADDPGVPPAEVAAFQDEMRALSTDWQLIAFGDAVHSFSNPGAGNDKSKGNAYNERADKRSAEAMKQFFQEVL